MPSKFEENLIDMIEHGQLEDALCACKKNVSLYGYHKEVAEFLNNTARRFKEKNSLNVAEKILKTSIDIYPGHVKSYADLGFVQKDLKKLKEAYA